MHRNNILPRGLRKQILFVLCLLSPILGAQAQTITATLATGQSPTAIAVNPATDMIYVANKSDDTVSIINGATNAITTVAVGTSPSALAANPNTGKTYVANYGSNSVTVISGTGATSTLAAG